MANGDLSGLQASISRVDEASRGRDADLGRDISNLQREVQQELRELEQRLGERIDEVSEHLAQLMNYISHSFEELKTSVDELNTTTREGSEQVVQEIGETGKSTREGLQRVSSGVAVIDVLKASADAQEMAHAIGMAKNEVKDRLDRVKAEISGVRENYDKRADEAYRGFDKQIRQVADHIIELQKFFQELLDEIAVDESADEHAEAQVRAAQFVTTRHRQRVLAAAIRNIDGPALGTFLELKKSVAKFIADPGLARFEGSDVEGESSPPAGAMSLPMVTVLPARSGYEAAGLRRVALALEAKAVDCYNAPGVPTQDGELAVQVVSLSQRVSANSASPMGEGDLARVRAGIDKLIAAGMLRKDDGELVKQHLGRHRLLWLEA